MRGLKLLEFSYLNDNGGTDPNSAIGEVGAS